MLLASRLHWSRDDIMALPVPEFEYYVQRLIELSTPPKNKD